MQGEAMNMEYRFFGWKEADAAPLADTGKEIHDPRDMYDVLSRVWCAETCAPRMRADWTLENRTLGQCSITAFLVQDYFGGRVYGIPLNDGAFHCFNVVGDCVFDLTSEQFGDTVLDYENSVEQAREAHFSREEKRLRYELLKKRFREA